MNVLLELNVNVNLYNFCHESYVIWAILNHWFRVYTDQCIQNQRHRAPPKSSETNWLMVKWKDLSLGSD